MAKRKISWTQKANFERKEILEYWINHNQSKIYSVKLNRLFLKTIFQVAENPTIGRKTEFEDVRVKIVRDYLLFYEYSQKHLKVLSIWNGHREEKTLKIKE